MKFEVLQNGEIVSKVNKEWFAQGIATKLKFSLKR